MPKPLKNGHCRTITEIRQIQDFARFDKILNLFKEKKRRLEIICFFYLFLAIGEPEIIFKRLRKFLVV